MRSLVEFVNLECEYFSSCAELLKGLRDQLNSGYVHFFLLIRKVNSLLLNTHRSAAMPQRTSMLNHRTLSGKISNEGTLRKTHGSNLSLSNGEGHTPAAAPVSAVAVPAAIAAPVTLAAASQLPYHSNSAAAPPARPMSMAKGGQKQVKVLFEFDAENANELSSKKAF